MEEAFTGAAEGARQQQLRQDERLRMALHSTGAMHAAPLLLSVLRSLRLVLCWTSRRHPYSSRARPFEGEKSAERWEALKYSSYT